MIALQRFLSAPRLPVVGLFVFLASCSPGGPPVVTARAAPPMGPPTEAAPPTPAVMNGSVLVSMMYERYRSSWYRTFTFVQKTSIPMASGGDLVQTWYEAGDLPGQLRIDTDMQMKSGVMYARDSIYRFTDGKLTHADTGINELLVLGFDVYTQPSATTEAVLRRLGFNLATMHQTMWQGKPVFVVGAKLGDTTSKQFWIEKDRLLFVRMLETNPKRGLVDVRFDKYQRAGKGWIAMRVEQYVAGKRTLLEEYSDVKTDVKLAADLFDPKQWTTVAHWAMK
jgi:hypothetical protein